MDLVPVLVSYHSRHWMGVAVESYLEHFPGERLLVVDNNPRPGEKGWTPDCERERAWLAAHPAVDVLGNPHPPDGLLDNRTHGAGMDLALAWCRAHGARVLVHFEPDCLVRGRGWRRNLLAALDRGAWMAGGFRQPHGPIHPTPTAWRVDRVQASFTITPWRGADETHPQFDRLMDRQALQGDTSPMGLWIGWTCFWDTGHRAWFLAAARGRAALVPTPGIRHYWHGSSERRLSPALLRRWYPETAPYLARAARRLPPRPVTACPHREPAGAGHACRLLRELTGTPGLVSPQACAACCAAPLPTAAQPNPVVASLVYSLADDLARHHGPHDAGAAERAAQLRDWAEPWCDVEVP